MVPECSYPEIGLERSSWPRRHGPLTTGQTFGNHWSATGTTSRFKQSTGMLRASGPPPVQKKTPSCQHCLLQTSQDAHVSSKVPWCYKLCSKVNKPKRVLPPKSNLRVPRRSSEKVGEPPRRVEGPLTFSTTSLRSTTYLVRDTRPSIPPTVRGQSSGFIHQGNGVASVTVKEKI